MTAISDRSLPKLSSRWLAVLGLMLLSPICAEYLIGYAESIADPLEMLAGLIILAPLYGAVAVFVREFARRSGKGWPTILLLATAFGLLQAGLIDQSLFNADYSSSGDEIPYWQDERLPTLIPALGISANHLVDFVAGHVIWSFAAPIVVVECCMPRIADRPWLGRFGLGIVVLLYLVAAVVVFRDHIKTIGFMATPVQLGTVIAIAAALIAAALLLPCSSTASLRPAPSPWLVGGFALAILAFNTFTTPGWIGVLISLVSVAVAGTALLVWSRRAGWNRLHLLSAAGAALLVNATLSFVVEPLGNPSYPMKYAANTAMLLGVLTLLGFAWRRTRASSQ